MNINNDAKLLLELICMYMITQQFFYLEGAG